MNSTQKSSNPVTVTQASIYKYCNDRSSNNTTFTTNHSCVSRVLGKKKNQFHSPKACNKASLPCQLVFWARGRSGQACNFWSSHPAAYFFLCQLLAVGSACGPLDLTKVACGPRLASNCVKCSSRKNNRVQLVSILCLLWYGRWFGREEYGILYVSDVESQL